MSDQMPGQLSMFDERPPEAILRATETGGWERVLREPGWTLLGDPGAPEPLWHLVASRRYDGVLTAVCGATGRYVADTEHEIIKCPACEAPTS